jgi:uncharacterized coiled-coil protein SlyX
MTRHEQLKQAALEAIQALFSDRSVSQEQTRESLEEVVTESEMYIDAINEDLKHSEGKS